MCLPAINEDDDNLHSMTVVPYLEDLHSFHSSDQLEYEAGDQLDGHSYPGATFSYVRQQTYSSLS